MSKKSWPKQVKEVMEALDKNAAEAEYENTMYVEQDTSSKLPGLGYTRGCSVPWNDDVWRIVCNYEQNNIILVYVNSDGPNHSTGWYYQRMYGDFSSNNLIRINGRLSQPMAGNHSEALGNANCWYTG